MTIPRPNLVVISGPTGVGKSEVAFQLAQKFNSIIISADSRQFYKEMLIGTAIPPDEYLRKIPHYFIRFISIKDYYNANKYEKDVLALLDDYFKKNNIAFLVGGSGLYIDAVCYGIDEMPDYDPNLRNYLIKQCNIYGLSWLRKLLLYYDKTTYQHIDLNNKNRMLRAIEVSILSGKPYSTVITKTKKQRYFNIIKIALNTNRTLLYNKIDSRVDQMIERGLIQEAKELYNYKNLTPLNTFGYKELFLYFDGIYSLDEAIKKIKFNTHKYARKQLTWLKRDKNYNWFEPTDTNKIINFIFKSLK
ncbi:MAG: tRNA (adenosine(37)-N6)-dimethylallyltransferase MiaA [Bacteroidales bacterium]|nr:tRNA (adenosine(37)-N6)-dimethylallyltransferase MiaA [Bacteroidales bacterium]